MTPLLRKISSLLSPLDDCYQTSGDRLPTVEAIEGPAMPEPYRRLLVHERDMTSTLEAYCGRRLHLRVLQKNVSEEFLLREVVLETDGDAEPWEFGAIRIHLTRFAAVPRQQIVECHRPLGSIIVEHGIEHRCRPTDFFRLDADRIAADAFGLTDSGPLYGRHTIITGTGNEPLAEVVEIIPPLDGRMHPAGH